MFSRLKKLVGQWLVITNGMEDKLVVCGKIKTLICEDSTSYTLDH